MTSLLLSLSLAHAATLQVGPTQTYLTVQDAVNAASSGDEIAIDPGVYEGAVVSGLDLTFRPAGGFGSATLIPTPTGPVLEVSSGTVVIEDLILDGQGTDRALDALFATVSMTGSELINGDAPSGDGGLILSDYTQLTLTDTTLTAGAWVDYGGAIYADHGSITLVGNTVIEDGVAVERGGGIYGDSTDITLTGPVLIQNNTTQDDGGGIYQFSGGDLIIDGATFLNNYADYDGAALKNGGDLAELYLEDKDSLGLSLDDGRLERATQGNDRGGAAGRQRGPPGHRCLPGTRHRSG